MPAPLRCQTDWLKRRFQGALVVSAKQAAAAVSAVIPVYNSSAFVAAAIESVYAQTALPGEVIVVDDGSTDDTPAVLRQFEGRPGFVLVRKANGGEASARNAGVERATGVYIAFLDHDDLWQPEKLERQLAQFDPAWGMSFTAYEQMTNSHSELVVYQTWDPDPRVVRRLLERSSAIKTCSTTLVRRAALKRVPPFESVVPHGTDYLMWLRFVAAGNKVGYLPEPLTLYRWHGDNLSNHDWATHLECVCKVFDLYGDRDARLRWHLEAAWYAYETGERQRLRKHLVQAARIRPSVCRPGWIRLMLWSARSSLLATKR